MCLYPKLIQNPKYKANQKNGGVIPPQIDKRTSFVPIGCGNCKECRKQKSREWNVRLHEEIKSNNTGKFITLTFNNEAIKTIQEKIYEKCTEKNTEIPTGYKLDNEISTYAIRHFLERWRKKYKQSIRHWLITELGHTGTENIHLHGILFTKEPYDEIERIWNNAEEGPYGFIWPKKEHYKNTYVNEKTVNYITKYVTKLDKDHPNYKAIILTSPGIGAAYTKNKHGDWKNNKFKEAETNETYQTREGYKLGLPIYYKNKIYTEEEREALWLHKLDKGERYINGIKFKNDQQYIEALKWAQRENIELGYGSNKNNWKQEEYEYQRRLLVQAKRIQNASGEGSAGIG